MTRAGASQPSRHRRRCLMVSLDNSRWDNRETSGVLMGRDGEMLRIAAGGRRTSTRESGRKVYLPLPPSGGTLFEKRLTQNKIILLVFGHVLVAFCDDGEQILENLA